MSKLSALLFSVQREEILLPRLRKYLADTAEAVAKGTRPGNRSEMEEADLTIKAMNERKTEYNHQAADGDKYAGYYHPSRIGSCIRQQWFDAMRAQQEAGNNSHDALRMHFICGIGTNLHVLFQNLCEKAGVLVAREVSVVDHPRKIVGHADGIVKLEGKKYLIEIKTTNERKFSKLVEADSPHIEQSNLYLGLLKLDGVIVIYINKNTSEMKEFRSAFNRSLYENRLLPRIAKHHADVRSKTLPPREADDRDRFPCTFCAYANTCWDSSRLSQFLSSINARKQQQSTCKILPPLPALSPAHPLSPSLFGANQIPAKAASTSKITYTASQRKAATQRLSALPCALQQTTPSGASLKSSLKVIKAGTKLKLSR